MQTFKHSYTALFGGSFNPVHMGHIRLAIEVLEYTSLPFPVANVELIPCATPVLKAPEAFLPFALRVAMLESACKNISQVRVNTLEGKREGPSYTWHTLQSYKLLYPQQPLLFVLGMENLSALGAWYMGRELPRLADFGVMPRGDGQKKTFIENVRRLWPQATFGQGENGPVAHIEYDDQYTGRLFYMPLPRMEISATAIRERWLAGRNIDLLMPPTAQALLEIHAVQAQEIWKGENHGHT